MKGRGVGQIINSIDTSRCDDGRIMCELGFYEQDCAPFAVYFQNVTQYCNLSRALAANVLPQGFDTGMIFELSYFFATCPELARDKKARCVSTPRKARDKLKFCVTFCVKECCQRCECAAAAAPAPARLCCQKLRRAIPLYVRVRRPYDYL